MPLLIELLALGVIAIALLSAVAAAQYAGFVEDSRVLRGGIAAGLAATAGREVSKYYEWPWYGEAVAIVAAFVLLLFLLGQGERLRQTATGE